MTPLTRKYGLGSTHRLTSPCPPGTRNMGPLMPPTSSQVPSLLSPSILSPQPESLWTQPTPHLLGRASRGPFNTYTWSLFQLKNFRWLPTAWRTTPKRPSIQGSLTSDRARLADWEPTPLPYPLPSFLHVFADIPFP